MRKSVFLFLMITLLLSGCSPWLSKDSKNKPIVTKPMKLDTLEKRFIPPHFIVRNFRVTYNKKINEFSILLKYEISDKLYKILSTKGQKYYFFVQLPSSTEKIIHLQNTGLVEGEKVEKRKLSYKVVFKQKLKDFLTLAQAKMIKSRTKNYHLNVVNKYKEIIHIFNDIGSFVPFEHKFKSTIKYDNNIFKTYLKLLNCQRKGDSFF